jgi:hypothetical protein
MGTATGFGTGPGAEKRKRKLDHAKEIRRERAYNYPLDPIILRKLKELEKTPQSPSPFLVSPLRCSHIY